MSEQKVPFSLRIPQTLLLSLKKLAQQNKRSANREAEHILEQYITEREKHPEQ